MRLGILTGGGDVPGLNACIKAAVNRAVDEGHEIVGIRRGWWGLLHYNPDDPQSQQRCTISLDKQVVRTIDRTGGTFLHTSRTNPSKVKPEDAPDFLRGSTGQPVGDKPAGDKAAGDKPADAKPAAKPVGDKLLDFTPHVLKAVQHLRLDGLLPIGGDDTLSYGARLHQEGVPVVAIPKTMDNDVFGTDYCIGFSTAVTRSVEIIHQLRTNAGSHERIAVIELFGRNSGETSLIAAYLAGVDRALISEVHFDPEKLARLIMEDKRANPSNYAMLTVSEGAQAIGGQVHEYGEEDAYGHRKLGGIGDFTGEALKSLTGEHIIYQQVAYLMRSGAPDSLDLMVAVNFAMMATTLAANRAFGRMVSLRNGMYTNVPITIINQGKKRVDVEELYDVEQYRPKVRYVESKPMFLY
jgi:ATP-dependent phosphofructokinase / diphosphate-dependent phosphofructokinase